MIEIPSHMTPVEVRMQADADLMIPLKLRAGHQVAVVGCPTEPMDLSPWLAPDKHCENCDVVCTSCPWGKAVIETEDGPVDLEGIPKYVYSYPLNITWLIVRGGDDPMHPDWVRSLRDQAVAAGVPFCFEGWGEWLPGSQYQQHHYDHTTRVEGHPCGWAARVGRSQSGRLLDGVEWDQRPEGA